MRAVLILLIAGVWHSCCLGVPIKFTYSGIGSGAIGETAFTDKAFVISAYGDTSTRYSFPAPVLIIGHQSAEILLDGIGEFMIETPTRSFVNKNGMVGPAVGMSREFGNSDLVFTTHPTLASWGMLTSIGPIAGAGGLTQWGNSFDPVITNGGRLEFIGNPSTITFQAVVIPEPSTLAIFAIGCVAIGRRRRCCASPNNDLS